MCAAQALAGRSVDIRLARSINARRWEWGKGEVCGGGLLAPFVGHSPVVGTPAEPDVRLAIIFRSPAQRLISAYLDSWHSPGWDAVCYSIAIASYSYIWLYAILWPCYR